MDRPDHEAIIALRIAVIEVQAENAAVTADKRRGEGRLLVRMEHMSKVERHAEVRQADFLERKQGGRAVGHKAVGSRLIGLIFDANEAIRIVPRDPADAIDLVSPEPRVISLKGVIKAVLPEPQRHQIGARLAGGVDPLLRETDSFAANGGIRIGEGADLEGWVGIVPDRQAVHRETEVADG